MDAVTGAPEPLDELVTHAHETSVVVIGGGIAGLVAALECAKVGMPVTLLEASDRLGGTIASAEIDGLLVDVGATCWSTRGGAVKSLVDELGLGERVVMPRTDQTWISGTGRGSAAPVPADAVLGIPANPWDDAVRRIIGWRGIWRAYVDRLRPPLTIGKQRNLAALVRSRMGAAVLDRLVTPLSVGGFGVAPDEIDVVAAAPGLTTALTRTGSLGGAVADLLVDRDGSSPIAGLDGGMTPLVAAIAERLGLLGADVVTGARVARLTRVDARWRIDLAPAADEDGPAAGDAADAARLSGGASRGPLRADLVIVATGERAARGLLGLEDAAPGADGVLREVVTLVVDAPALDARPRGAEVYPVPGTRSASGLVHQTARWEWLARAAGPGRHVLSVAFDGPTAVDAASDAPAGHAAAGHAAAGHAAAGHPTRGLDDRAAIQRAVAEASALLGSPLDESAVRGARREAFVLARPASTLGHAEATAAVRARIGRREGLAAVGAWLAGSGISRVAADARAEADRLRRSALWGRAAAG
jgi:oxygen-dependent protoporphyrinogen oxidase